MSELITTQLLKDGYLAGVRLTDQNGTPFPDTLYSNAIKSATSWFFMRTKIRVTPFPIVNESHDYYADEFLKFCFLTLYEYPIQSVSQIQAIYPTGQTILMFPSTWLKINLRPGQIQLVPTAGTLTQVLLGQGGFYLPLLSGALPYLPQLFFVTYTAGYATDGIPDEVNDVIGMRAALYVLDAAGSTVLEPGIGSKSLSVDGLSQSMSIAPGRYGPYSGRYTGYMERIEEAVQIIQQRERGVPFTVL